jgi:hypothetical protein
LKQWFFAFAALSVVTYLAWGNALNGYFIADDAWHVPLVYRALHEDLGLLWRQFVSPYSFHDSLYLMYRPLTDISFAIDCLIWKGDARGYHLQNLIWHGISACMVFVFSRSLMKYVVLRDIDPARYLSLISWKIPLMVALLFVVYPGHAEPVCWPLPRIDLIAGTFTFLSLTCILEYFTKEKRVWLICSILAMIPGLLIKEMSASIPFVAVVLYVISDISVKDSKTNLLQLFISRVQQGVIRVWPMFVVLAIYIVHRGLSLGSLIGGYVGTIGAGLNGSFLPRLFSIDAYWRLFHPINENVLGKDSIQDLLIRGIYLLLAVLILLNRRTPCAAMRLKGAGKLLFLLFIMVLPCLQIWGVTGGLIGARHAYALCVPFLLAIVVLIYPITTAKSRSIGNLRRTATALLWATFVLFFVMSRQYAKSWSEATRQIDKIRSEIVEHAEFLSSDRKLVIAGLPTGIKGFCAFYTIDFLPGLLMPPLSDTDIRSKVICIDGTPTNDYVINRSLLKTVIHDDKTDLNVWVDSDNRFVSLNIPLYEFPMDARKLKVEELGAFARPRELTDGTTFFANKTLGSELQSFKLSMDESVGPLDFEILELEVSCEGGKPNPSPDVISMMFPDGQDVTETYSENNSSLTRHGRYGWLSWTGQLSNRGESALPIYFPVFTDEKSQTYRINLTQYKTWLFSGSSNAFRVDLPVGLGNFKVLSATLKQATDYIPELSFAGKGELRTNGLYATTTDQMRFKYDASKIREASKVLVEVSIPYYEFHVQPHTYRQNTRSPYVAHTMELDKLSGEFSVPNQVVSKPAYYQIRICALNSKGELLGSFSDPVTLSTVVHPLGSP